MESYDKIKGDLERIIKNGGDTVNNGEQQWESVYLGSYMSLDPCGRYHHAISPNGASSECETYWENLETAAEELGASIESGDGDPTDIYLTWGYREMEEETENE